MKNKIPLLILFIILSQTSCEKQTCVTCYNTDVLNTGRVVDSAKACAGSEGDARKEAMSKLSLGNGYLTTCKTK